MGDFVRILFAKIIRDGHPHHTATPQQHGGHPRQGYEAGDGGASLAVGAWVSVSAKSSSTAREA